MSGKQTPETTDRHEQLLKRIESHYARLDEKLRELEQQLPEIPTPDLPRKRRRRPRKPR